MPNTPALVDEGMAAISPGTHATEHLDHVTEILSATGRVVTVPERYQDAVTAISGSGPAYLFFVVEAMIEAGVHLGLPRDISTELVVQTMLGSAKMLRETGEHPTVLRERVTSPGGTTAAAVGSWRTTRCEPPSSGRWRRRGTAAGRWPRRPRADGRRAPGDRDDGLLVHSEELTRYDFGDDHPMAPGRVTAHDRAGRAAGRAGPAEVVPPPPIDVELMLAVHDPDYIDAVGAANPNPAYGLGSTDNPIFPRMHEISATVAMATVGGGAVGLAGEVRRACNISGGLHHAMPGPTSGFCVYNDLAVAISWLLDNGCERIAYVDVDVHHGDGVQQIFYHDPRVLTVSLHETPAVLFPGHRLPVRDRRPRLGLRGQRRAAAGTRDAGWLRAFHAVVPQVLRGLPAADPGHPARLRLAPARSAGRPGSDRGRAARLLPGAGRAGRRAVRGALGVHRRRWLRGRTWCRAPGPTCWRSSAASRSRRRRRAAGVADGLGDGAPRP